MKTVTCFWLKSKIRAEKVRVMKTVVQLIICRTILMSFLEVNHHLN